MRFTIFTHVEHFKEEDKYFGYTPYIREMNIWLKYVEELEVVAPAPLPITIGAKGGKHINGASYQHFNLTFTKIPSFDLLNLYSAFKAIFKLPIIFFKTARAMKRSDHLHLRCPGNVGLLASICQIFFPEKIKTAKYAGNWDPDAKQPWSYKLQKWILSNTFLTRNMTVLVYGKWPDQSENTLPFFTASFSENEKGKTKKIFSSPYKFLFVGNLVPGKQPLFAFYLVEALKKKNINAELHVYGDGELMDALMERAKNKAYIHIHGNQPLNVLIQAYKDSHFLVLASKSEGWPKAVAEAMFFGCIPVVSNVSCLSWMLNYGSRGILIPGGRVERGKRKVDSQNGLGGVDSQDAEKKLLDTFQKNRQFECFPDSPEGERGNVSRTGFSETLEVTSGKNESQDVLENTVRRIIELIKNPEEMKGMSMEGQEWSQEYTLEKFEEEIKKLLVPKDVRP